MQITYLATLLYLVSSIAAAPQVVHGNALSLRDAPVASINSLEKRKGGGGGGGRGGSSGGSSSSGGRTSSGSGSTSSGGRTSGGVSSSGRTYSYSGNSNAGGSTRSGSGSPRSYGGRYAGGAAVPYTAGGVSPTRRIAPYALLPLGALAFFPALWLYPAFAYNYPIGYRWYGNGRNNTANVTCLCQEYSVCGCDPTDNSTFLNQVLTNGTGGAPVNSSLVRTVDYNNGTIISYINGTLDNGTTAPGGSDPSNDDEANASSGAGTKIVVEYAGYWAMIATVMAGIAFV